jgi:hypothetical protein
MLLPTLGANGLHALAAIGTKSHPCGNLCVTGDTGTRYWLYRGSALGAKLLAGDIIAARCTRYHSFFSAAFLDTRETGYIDACKQSITQWPILVNA